MAAALNVLHLPLDGTGGGVIPRGTRTEVFSQIYWVFLVLGTLVGLVVIGYMVYNGYKYRDGSDRDDEGVDRPELGELPQGSGGGKKLFSSFALSTIIVVSLIAWTYGTLLYVEQPTHQIDGPGGEAEEPLHIRVEGYRFGWDFIYPNGHKESGVLRVPVGREVSLTVTSRDVFHNFGIPALKVKTDAIPGQTTDTWFIAEETGNYQAACYELCGAGHSYMEARVIVMEPAAYQRWYANTTGNATATPTPSGQGNSTQHGLTP